MGSLYGRVNEHLLDLACLDIEVGSYSNTLLLFSDGETRPCLPACRHNGGLYPSNPYGGSSRQSSSAAAASHLGGLEGEQLEPQFLIKGQKVTAKLGDTVVLPCKVANLGE